MLQRIQTIYYLIAFLLISALSFGIDIFKFHTKAGYFTLTIFGLNKFSSDNKFVETMSHPLFLVTILIALLLFFTIMSFKNLKKQLLIGRITLTLQLVVAIILLILFFFGEKLVKEEFSHQTIASGFYLFVVSFPLILLGNMGVSKDKKLLDSLNRLR